MSTFSKIQKKLQIINNSRIFQAGVIIIILLSALSIGVNTHVGDVDLLRILDTFITVFFVFELSVRFIACEDKKSFFKSGWNIFDLIIVVGSLIPAGGNSVLLARLLRVFRVLRLVSMIPELRLLVNALVKAIPQMGYIALLMFVIFYIYAAAGSMLFQEVNEDLWGDVSIAMLTLFRVATFEDWTDVMYETMDYAYADYSWSWIYYLTFIFLSTFIFLNMMVGTILDVMGQEHEKERASAHGESEDEAQPASRAQVQKLEDEITQLKQMILELKDK